MNKIFGVTIPGQEKRVKVVERRGRWRPGTGGGPNPGRADQGVANICVRAIKSGKTPDVNVPG